MNLVRRFVVTALSVLVVAAVAAVLVLGRPAPGPLPFPSSQPVALVSIPASAEPRASAVPSSAEPLVLPAIDPEDPPGALAGPCLTSMGIVDYAVPPSIASERRRSF